MERISEVFSNGACTWMQNPVLCAPFLLDLLLRAVFFMFVIAGVAITIGTDAVMKIASELSELAQASSYTDELSPEVMYRIYHLVTPFIGIFIVAFLILIIGCALIQAFFESGAIGMAKTAVTTGTTGMRDLFNYGRQSAIDLFLANIAITLLFLAGIVFLVPGVILIRISGSIEAYATIIVIGLILLILYIIILLIGLSPVKYALVIDHTDPIEGIEKGWKFFSDHKFDVFLMCLVMFGISIILGLIGNIFYMNPVTTAIWQFVGVLIDLCIIMPLITVWWTRLYLSREPVMADTPAQHRFYQ
ncbi:MAG: hypothetical protein U9N07_02085 [Euryarchaeota archaeon]|nr:hypothetical protein [Euryarchaeota archaeon]